jgi:glycosyltransferase involved in cell wall biosynthesis
MGQMPARYSSKCIYLPENGIDPDRFFMRRERRATLPLRVIFVGRLVPYKGADMLLEAAAGLIRAGKVQLSILGDGPQMALLKDFATREQLDGKLEIPGWIEHRDLQGRLATSDLLAFPSIREFGGGVALEAMAVGLPAAVVKYGGPAELVTDETGFLVELGAREEIVQRFRQLLERLCEHPGEIDMRSAACIERVREHFTWPAKAKRVVEIYRQLVPGIESGERKDTVLEVAPTIG